MRRILISAGDASGDAIGAALVRVLRRRHPDWRFEGLAGVEMRAAGVEAVADQAALAVGGFGALVSSAPRIVATWRSMLQQPTRHAPDVVVLIDAGGFHLPFARALRRRSDAPILYYVAPQVWAWRARRLRRLAERVDRIALILPDEPDYYAQRGVAAEFVGHPILDREVARAPSGDAARLAREQLGLAPDVPVLGLFPGSRRNEVARHLPIQLATARRLRDRGGAFSALRCLLLRAPSIETGSLEAIVEREARDVPILTTDDGIAAIDACDAALAKPGTVTLELALRGRPMVVMGRVGPLAAALARWHLQVSWLALPNLLAGREIVPERLQREAVPDRLAEALAPLFPDAADPERAASPAARAQRAAFLAVRARLGAPGASERVADLVEELVGTDRA
jgi:lipid-A-disaccharide synthase